MRTRLLRNFTLLVILFGVTASAWGQNPPEPKPPEHHPQTVLDHFLCYRLAPEALDPTPDVFLKDQWNWEEPNPKSVAVGERTLICDPVEKNDKPEILPQSHLVCYTIPKDKADRGGTFSNQFTKFKERRFKVTEAYLLCVPSGKKKEPEQKKQPEKKLDDGQGNKPDEEPPPAIPTDLDHFKCYLMQWQGVDPHPLHLHDQLIDDHFDEKYSILFCNPVEKTRLELSGPAVAEGQQKDYQKSATSGRKEPKPPKLLHPDAHLVCYKLIKEIDPKRKVRIANQFEPNKVITPLFTDLLCVPSTKRDAPKEKPKEK
jgi:hypothetical protein